MRIDIISVLPELMESPFQTSILKRAMDKGLAEVHFHHLRDWAINKHRQIDDEPYGGGAGMVMMIEPLDKCISELKSQRDYDEVIYLTPDGVTLNQKIANTLSIKNNLIFLCGHYKGIDQRVRDLHITKEISIGDYVLTGGELAACVLADSVIRLLPGVLNDEQSALTDSFQDDLLSPPIYTRPESYKGLEVPKILLSGNFAKIEEWRHDEAVRITKEKRPDLL
ncbi:MULTISPECIES: tRNA (guanosine(37)-N1)-methyltransferase TrmD [Chryseobacterium]|jgi:tRNA (guanine37-N1)-methyltransferase|uniref:tRNA (guanine-N(1)-)-methyltransferase n=1 Tax=Chryseobacterium rhizosphaerae TaxID=395937 RepID=A0AAE4C577_9FLAO|nr:MULTISPECIES: tRNA (guanosine(37)-N1)-methyltransferase TrmD [Chryseobacterium]MBL3549251.1 tRNA (guanosine(37)-N1)-methyltransferase TrmD [Chryseobacterium sp. KMC2]MDC8098658.1 tRNA (guanosine(37)-N1)-methyltransferase TrmD [Chryseobacterium rhizosphaerae]MDR6527405.1 tRNA (guanine37-N1)-methyltransferase [Chryseobacterium rhizosphaerae]MDR6547459.1 tRNA (guanine37-N1)-methyltransferase [Chryseobacterium rhizosphaerae]REC71643.1 tRNA (guanosine(37)-N1)-methyltransferase TrmD [Chryseobacte